jgi:hypothetical protein
MKLFSKLDSIKVDKIEASEINLNGNQVVTSNTVIKIAKVTQSEYDALTTKDPNTLYIIVE